MAHTVVVSVDHPHKAKKSSSSAPHSTSKVSKVMHEYKHGDLHSGSKSGPKVKSRRQAIAIGMSEQRKANKGGY